MVINRSVFYLITLLCFVFSYFETQAQVTPLSDISDTIMIESPTPFYSFNPDISGEVATLTSKKIKVQFVYDNSLFRFIPLTNVSEKVIKFRKCYFGNIGHTSLPRVPEIGNSKRLEFDSCNLRYLSLSKQGNETAIYNCDIGVLHIDSSTNYSLRISSSELTYGIFIENSHKLNFDLQNVSFRDSGEVRIVNSTLSSFGFLPSVQKGSKIVFINDTLLNYVTNYLSFNEDSIMRHVIRNKHNDTLVLVDCYLNCDFQLSPSPNNCVIEFNNCTFGSKANLRDLGVSGITLRNCIFPTSDIPLSINESYEADLVLINTDPEHLRFDFTSNIKLSFPRGYNSDIMSNTYQRLLSKYTNEGKPESYKQVDLQYQKFSKNKLFYFFSFIWWFHGYKPQLVFIWTGALLLIFFLINLRWWNELYSTYPIVPWSITSYYEENKPRKKLRSIVMLYTIFIFFSLKVDFNKLNFSRLPFVYLFLVQYFAGIWCLVFIVRYVIKL